MRLERERSDGQRDVWEAVVDGRRLTMRIKDAGMLVKHDTERFLTTGRAQAALERRAAALRAAGYVERGTRAPDVPVAREAALEAAMRDDRESPHPAAVYADWLQIQGSPVGELMALHQAAGGDPERERRARELIADLRLPIGWLATWGWKHGRWTWLRLNNDGDDSLDEAFEILPFARRLFALPPCAALDELRLGIGRLQLGHEDTPAVIAEAATHAWAPTLARLHLGDTGPEIDLGHHWIGEVGAPVSRAFPGLRALRLCSGAFDDGDEPLGLRGLELPALASLAVETCEMTTARIGAVLAAKLPALTDLELWFGAADRGATASVTDLAPLLEGRTFPAVTRLALKNHDLADALVARLSESQIAPRLVELDLSMSTLDDAAARVLAAGAARYAALRVLDVGDNYLSEDGLAVLRAAFPRADVRSEAQPKLAYARDGQRYVSASE